MSSLAPPAHAKRLLAGPGGNEDAAVLVFPQGQALIQSLDLLTPVVNDPYQFGRIAAANALSDIYAMGGTPWCAMNIACYPLSCMPEEVLCAILAGGSDCLAEAGATLVGGHSVEDPEIKYGLSVTGYVDPQHIATNAALKPGDSLFLTKPLGTGILSTAVKGQWEGSEALEAEICRWAGRLQKGVAYAIQSLQLRAATDVTGFGLAGHLLEMARASKVTVVLESSALPLMPRVRELADMGLLPAGGYANRQFCGEQVHIVQGIAQSLADAIFDPQTSGGMLLGVPAELRNLLPEALGKFGDVAWEIGRVEAATDGSALVELR